MLGLSFRKARASQPGRLTRQNVFRPDAVRLSLHGYVLSVLDWLAPRAGEAQIALSISPAVYEGDQMFQYPGIAGRNGTGATMALAFATIPYT
jgi:hypothetical protein